MSSIFATLFMPDATTRMSRLPWASTASPTMASTAASEFGRAFTVATAAPSSRHSPATASSASALPPVRVSRQPDPARVRAATAPNAPDAPVTSADFPVTSKMSDGFIARLRDRG